MGVAKNMLQIATECVSKPGRVSIWSPRHNRYVCSRDPRFQQAKKEQSPAVTAAHQPVSAEFKLVFLTVAIGTAFFITLCVVVRFVIGAQPDPMAVRLIEGLLTMSQIGVGAIAGLLGGKAIKANKDET